MSIKLQIVLVRIELKQTVSSPQYWNNWGFSLQ